LGPDERERPVPSYYEVRRILLRRIARLRDAVEHINGHGFVAQYTPHYKRGDPKPNSLPVPSAAAWVVEVLAGDNVLAVEDAKLAAPAAAEGR
jgi:hypothetical protein